MPDGYRGVCAPDVPDAVRRRLSDAGPDPATVLLAAVVAVLAGVAGTAVLVSGARPDGASPVFGAVVGGGGLLVALVSTALAVRGAAALRRRRTAERAGWYVSAGSLAELAARDPAAGDLVAQAQAAVERIRCAAPGTPAAAVDGVALRRIEWSVVEAARAPADDAGRARLAAEVTRLTELAESAGGHGVEPAPDGTAPVSRLADELDRAGLIATEMRRFAHGDKETTD
ncbi:hypothetical protein [Actinocatenispora rupis]|uniref:Uncharacterized protein n=1 Tax=Actinocatenispora rupis TaxID=519421 RepID=A0A8J3NDH1_9ACTN|nr:hypothetical protein [Actinocatenispora rupis]GID12920.1 hypothetical protein Aru02nite_38090 [Actinocatenispora rupis]